MGGELVLGKLGGVAAFTGGVDGNGKRLTAAKDRCKVAAFTGGVDGNLTAATARSLQQASPPSRAAWIEITNIGPPYHYGRVAAFTGGVDGNPKLIEHVLG